MDLVLTTMLKEIDYNTFNRCFDSSGELFSGIKRTTWLELSSKGYITPEPNRTIYYITGKGWLKALQVSNGLKDEQFKQFVERFCSALKGQVKGRHCSVQLSP